MPPTLKAITGESKDRKAKDTIGKRIKSLRRFARLTIGDVVRETGYDRSYISKVEHDRTPPAFGFLQRFADLTGVSFGHIITGREVKRRNIRGGEPEQVGNVLASVLDSLVKNKETRPSRRSDKAHP